MGYGSPGETGWDGAGLRDKGKEEEPRGRGEKATRTESGNCTAKAPRDGAYRSGSEGVV